MAYTIQKGDTLSALAKKYNTTVNALAKSNNISNPNLIIAGKTLNIPGQTAVKPAATTTPVKPAAVTPSQSQSNTAVTNAQPGYTGPSAQEIANAWATSQKSGLQVSANDQITNIQNNLAAALSNLQAEQAGDVSQNAKDIKNIEATGFATGEQQKELMNQSGWNPTNSGLAIGELTKVKNTTNSQKAASADSLSQALADIARRTSLSQNEASTNITNVNNDLSQRLAGVDADAIAKAGELGYSQYRDTVSDYQNNRNFDYQKGVDDRNYNYQVDRDKITDAQWLKNFTEEQRQAMVSEAISKGQLSVSQGNLALSKAAQAWSQSSKNPDNQYKQAQIDSLKSKSSGGSSDTVGALYQTMIQSSDPDSWLTQNSNWLTDDEFNALYKIVHPSGGTTLDQAVKNLNR